MSVLDRLIFEGARRRGLVRRREFSHWLKEELPGALQDADLAPTRDEPTNLRLVGFSGARDFEEQALSILTARRWLGCPVSWTIYSDGTRTAEQDERLCALMPPGVIRFQSWQERIAALPQEHSFILDYAEKHPFGKRLVPYATHPLDGPTLFCDSDVLFYPLAADLLGDAVFLGGSWFMPDPTWGGVDSRYFKAHRRQMYVGNGGFYLLQPGFDWNPMFDWLRPLNGDYELLSEQTAIHVAMRANRAMPLDPRTFAIDWLDQFQWGLAYPDLKKLAARHYVGIVRHKMWQFGWRSHLKQ